MPQAQKQPVRRTKILTTLGPTTDKPGILDAMVKAGIDVVRINFSHGDPEEHRQRVESVRAASAKYGRHVAILGDLQGPKIRIARFKEGAVNLEVGQPFIIDMDLGRTDGDEHQVGCDYKDLAKDLFEGDVLLLDDGRLVFEVTGVAAPKVHCKVLVGGKLSNNKGINKQGGGLSAAALTEKDKIDMQTAIKLGVDYIAVSFPRSAADMEYARELLHKYSDELQSDIGKTIGLVAKVERAEAVSTDEILDGIIKASDAVMVARGDLGVEIGDARLIGAQKNMIKRAQMYNTPVINATQALESMINAPLPTRAEVMDVGNAVLDGADAVMCSAETAAGDYPVETVEAMKRAIAGAEALQEARRCDNRNDWTFERLDETVAYSAMFAANHLEGVAAVACLTETGHTPLVASRIRSDLPIVALSPSDRTLCRMSLYKGVVPVKFDASKYPTPEVNRAAVELVEEKGLGTKGDYVVITRGDHHCAQGTTNSMKIVEIGEHIG